MVSAGVCRLRTTGILHMPGKIPLYHKQDMLLLQGVATDTCTAIHSRRPLNGNAVLLLHFPEKLCFAAAYVHLPGGAGCAARNPLACSRAPAACYNRPCLRCHTGG